MKKRSILLAVLIGLFSFFAFADTEYQAYLEMDKTPEGSGIIEIVPAEYSRIDMPGSYVTEEGDLYTSDSGEVEYTFVSEETAMYTVEICYFPGKGTGADIQRSVMLNGEIPYEEMGRLSFSRMWNNKDDSYKTVKGNQPFPSQVETPQWRTVFLRDSEGYVEENLRLRVLQGENKLTIASLREGMFIRSIRLVPQEKVDTYDEYIAKLTAEGKTRYTGEGVKIQAEDACLKSGPGFYPLNDRTSAVTEPYHYTNIVLNIIGGSAWNEPGEWLMWELEAPESGLYRICFRFKQSDLRGLYATRRLTINGKVPFEEANDLRFYYDGDWQFGALGEFNTDGECEREYWFYLDEGVNRIALEVSLGALGDILLDINEVTNDLNALYREIVAITGSSPDSYRDYKLFTRIPDLSGRLKDFGVRVTEIQTRLTALTGSNSERTAGMSRLIALIDRISDDENDVVKQLSSFKECITSMGKSVLDLADQPLKLDVIVLAGEKMPKVKAEGNFFQQSWHTLRAFIGSFVNDYNVSGDNAGDHDRQIDVWLSTGRDQFDVIRRLINESFEPEYGIKVNLKLIGADVALPATATGNGPDAIIQIANSAPVNFAFRNAAYDLTQFEDYEEVASRFHEAALLSSEYEGGVYGLPDQMSYPVMFVRTDILESLGLTIPETWSDLVEMIPVLEKNNMEIYLDTNPVSTLGANLSMGNSRAINTVFLSLLYQRGGEIYSDDNTSTMFDTLEANEAFKTWTKFYTQHNFPQDIDFATRFRIGEVPVGIVDLSYYNTLAVSAPEIRGNWTIARVPGTQTEDGSVAHDVPCVTSAAMIVKNMAEKNDTVAEAWEFIKWWTDAPTQTTYAREMEAVLGTSGRYLVANLESYSTAEWPRVMENTIREALNDLHGIKQVPGGYITGRYIYNAFITVITEYENAADTLFEFNELINDEIDKKREEFGLARKDATESR